MSTLEWAMTDESWTPIAEWSGEIGPDEDEAGGIFLSFEVPDHMQALHIHVRMRLEGGRPAFQLHDPIRDRGCFIPWFAGESEAEFSLYAGRDQATAGLLQGPIVAGTWTLHLSALRVRGAMPYSIRMLGIAGDKEKVRWFAGDLHTHSNHSDGIFAVTELVRTAKDSGLQFLCLTDHNTMSGFAEWVPDGQSGESDFLVLKGTEYTTKFGHANAFGLHEPVDWRVDGRKRTFSHVAAETKAQGALFSINHPFCAKYPSSNWADWDIDVTRVDCLEIWNHLQLLDQSKEEELALRKWDEWLNRGYRITGVGGSDAVHRHSSGEHRIGKPTVYIGAERLTRDDLLKGIKEARVIVTAGPLLQTGLSYAGRTFMVGDRIAVSGEAEVEADAIWHGDEEGFVQWVKNGEVAAEAPLRQASSLKAKIVVQGGDWLRVQLRNQNRQLLAFANPFFFAAEPVG